MRVWSHRRLSPEESGVVGIVGEMHAYRFLRKEFGGRAVHASAWVSESRLKVLPLVEGERDKTSDGHGFNFRFNHNGVRWHVEVKATKGGNRPSIWASARSKQRPVSQGAVATLGDGGY